MSSFLKAWEKTGKAEGGYVNDPNDSGGETIFGITKRVARQHGYHGDMRNLPKDLALQIAKRAYWDVMSLDDIAGVSENVALEMFDTGFNTGPKRAVLFLQRALNALNRQEKDYPDMVVDGAIGPVTITALNSFLAKRGKVGETVILRTLNGLQLEFYVDLVERRSKDEEFLFGWVSHRIEVAA